MKHILMLLTGILSLSFPLYADEYDDRADEYLQFIEENTLPQAKTSAQEPNPAD